MGLPVNVSGGIMGVMGIIADVLNEWSQNWHDGGISSKIWAVGGVGLVYSIFLVGTTKNFEKALGIMVALMGLSFFINFSFHECRPWLI